MYDFPAPTSPGFRGRFNMPGFPGDLEDSFRHNSFEHPANDPPRHHSAESGADNKPIPIRVVHERTMQSPGQAKNRLSAGSGRNTTEIPTRANTTESPTNIQSEKSPRLERAHSEPPKLFNQRMRASGATSPAPPAYSTIPENSESVENRATRFPQSPRVEPDTTNHKLSSSASAPSVPATNHVRPASGPPTAPPRRSTLNRNVEREEPVPQAQTPQPEAAPKVRHIPIFVEGRDEPVAARKTSQPENQQPGYRQPSDFYPQNVQKVRSQSVSSPGAGSASVPGFARGGLNLKPHQQQAQHPMEPTSPLSPPPSDQPIPMGCSDYFVHPTGTEQAPQKLEPTSPAPIPLGPIPMPYTSDTVDNNPPAPEVYTIPVKIIETPEPPKPEEPKLQQESKELSPAESKLQKIQSEIAEILQRVEKFSGGKRDKEYLFLDDLLTQKLCLLDSIESDGREDIRMMRKDSIKTVNRCLSILDKRATLSNAAKNATINDKENGNGNAAQVSNQVLSELAAQSQKEEEGPKNDSSK